MERANAVFLLVVALAVVVGAVAGTGYGGELQASDDSTVVATELEIDVTDAVVRDGSLEITVMTANPTRQDLTLTGTSFRVHNESVAKLADGPGTLRSGETSLPAGESVTATYRVRVSPSGLEPLEAALADDAAVRVTHSVQLRGVSTSVIRTDPAPRSEGR